MGQGRTLWRRLCQCETGEEWQMGAFAGWQKREIRRGKRRDRDDREDLVWGDGRVGAIHCCCECGSSRAGRRGKIAGCPGGRGVQVASRWS